MEKYVLFISSGGRNISSISLGLRLIGGRLGMNVMLMLLISSVVVGGSCSCLVMYLSVMIVRNDNRISLNVEMGDMN